MKDANTQYAVEGRRAKIVCHVYTHVNSEIKWFFNGEKLMMDERYNSNLYPSGQWIFVTVSDTRYHYDMTILFAVSQVTQSFVSMLTLLTAAYTQWWLFDITQHAVSVQTVRSVTTYVCDYCLQVCVFWSFLTWAGQMQENTRSK